jgi:pectinesterase
MKSFLAYSKRVQKIDMFRKYVVTLLSLFFVIAAFAQSGRNSKIVSFKQLTKVEDYSRLPEASICPIADTILAYQFPNGGWPLDQHWELSVLSEEDAERRAGFRKAIRENEACGTIQDGATTLEIFYLTKVFQKTGDTRYQEAALRGIEYLLNMQYQNGGWPLYWPAKTGVLDQEVAAYAEYITFNGDAMINVMQLLKNIYENKPPYNLLNLDESIRARSMAAFYKGVLCILDCQVKRGDQLTVWAQQYHQETLQPMKARGFEVPALTGCGETVRILSLLMDIQEPSKRVLESVTAGVHWLEKNAIRHKKVLHYVNRDGLRDVKVSDSRDTTLVWNRFYDIETDRPFFSDYDGIQRESINDISYDLRNNYEWISGTPDAVIKRYYRWIPGMRKRLRELNIQ